MRYIHPIGIHEKFVASGTYLQTDTDKGLTEWAIHEMPDGAWMIRLDRDGRNIDGMSMIAEVWRSPASEGGKIARFDIWSFSEKQHAHQVKARYFVVDNILEMSVQIDDAPQQTQSLAFPNNGVLLLEMPLLWGFATWQMMGQGAVGKTFTCSLNIDNPSSLSPVAYEDNVIVEWVNDVQVQIGNHDMITHRYKTPYGWLWLDDLGIVVAYGDPDNPYVVQHYARRPTK